MNNIGYQLMICEHDTGIVLNDAGGRMLGVNADDHLPYFKALSEAKSAREELLERIPWCEVSIKDLNSGEIDNAIVSPHYSEFKKQNEEWTKWKTAFPLIRPFIKKPNTPLIEQLLKAQPSVAPNPPTSGPVD